MRPSSTTGERLATFEQVAATLFPALSPAQRCVCRLVEGLGPRDAEQRDIYGTLLGRPWGPDLAGARKVVVLLFGAGSGKSWLAALYAFYRANTADLAGLAPGERLWIPVVAPEIQLGRVIMGYVAGLASMSSDIEGEPLTDSVHWTRGTSVGLYAATAGGRSVRARRFPLVVLDEIAYFRDRSYAVNDQEIVDAVLPRLRRAGQILALTTPRRRTGWVHAMYTRWYRAENPQALVLHGSTDLLNPSAEAAPELMDSAVMRRERMAEWVDEESSLVEGDWLVRAMAKRPHHGPPYCAALDLAGEGRDLTALALGCADGRGGVTVVGVHAWAAQPLEVTVEAIVRACEALGVRTIDADSFSFAAAQALFARHRIGLRKRVVTAITKAAMWARVRELLRSGALALPKDPALAHELEAVELHAGNHGVAMQVVLPRTAGGHCDRAVAVALLCDVLAERAWQGVRPIGRVADAPEPRPDNESW